MSYISVMSCYSIAKKTKQTKTLSIDGPAVTVEAVVNIHQVRQWELGSVEKCPPHCLAALSGRSTYISISD